MIASVKAPSESADAMTITTAHSAVPTLVYRSWRLFDNNRIPEAIASLTEAVALDPACAVARADLGFLLSGEAGLTMLKQAESVEATTEAERLYVAFRAAMARGDLLRSYHALQMLTALRPNWWRAHWMLAQVAAYLQRPIEAIAECERAVAGDSSAGPAHNFLGYLYLQESRTDEAIGAFRRYVEVSGGEANAFDSLGDVLMSAGHLEEAEAAYRKAAETGSFPASWGGVAMSRFFRGDSAGGRAALDRQRAEETGAKERLAVDLQLAFSLLSERRSPEAIAVLVETTHEASERRDDNGKLWAMILHGLFLTEMGENERALLVLEDAERTLEASSFAEYARMDFRGEIAMWRLAAFVGLGRIEEARRVAAAVEELLALAPGNLGLQVVRALARGRLLLATGDPRAAAAQFAACRGTAVDYCQWLLSVAEDAAGEHAAAAATRAKLMRVNRRDGFYLYIRARIQAEVGDRAGQPEAPRSFQSVIT